MKPFPSAFLLAAALALAAAPVQWAWAASGKVPSGYEVIVKNDPFDPARGEGMEGGAEDAGVQGGGLSARFQVYGTIIVDGKRRAFLKVRAAVGQGARGPTRSVKTVSVGDLVEGWKVADITDKGIVLESDGDKVFLGVFETPKKERAVKRPVDLTGHPGTTVPGGAPRRRGDSSPGGTGHPVKALRIPHSRSDRAPPRDIHAPRTFPLPPSEVSSQH